MSERRLRILQCVWVFLGLARCLSPTASDPSQSAANVRPPEG